MYPDEIVENELVWQHFTCPQCVGPLIKKDKPIYTVRLGSAKLSSALCLQAVLRYDAESSTIKIEEIAFRVYGCGYQIAVCSWMCSKLMECKTLPDESLADTMIVALQLPEHKWHCAYLMDDAILSLRKALGVLNDERSEH